MERCQGAGCTSFALSAQPAGTATTKATSRVAPGTSYGYRVRATDAAGNLGALPNIVLRDHTGGGPAGLVAAYGFDAGTGTRVADASGNGNTGALAGATWAAPGIRRGAFVQRDELRVDVPNSTSLQLTTGMTLEAWVNPATVTAHGAT